MCDPVSIAVGVAVVGAAASAITDIQGANQANKALKKQLKVKEKSIDQQTTAEINSRLRQARRDQSRILVAAGESGLNPDSGAIEGLLTDASMQASLDNEQSLANRESRKEAARAEADSMAVSKPTLLGAGLQIALAGANAYAGGMKAQARSNTPATPSDG